MPDSNSPIWGVTLKERLENPDKYLGKSRFEAPPHTNAFCRYASTFITPEHENITPQGLCSILSLIFTEIIHNCPERDISCDHFLALAEASDEVICQLHANTPAILECLKLPDKFCNEVKKIFAQGILVPNPSRPQRYTHSLNT